MVKEIILKWSEIREIEKLLQAMRDTTNRPYGISGRLRVDETDSSIEWDIEHVIIKLPEE